MPVFTKKDLQNSYTAMCISKKHDDVAFFAPQHSYPRDHQLHLMEPELWRRQIKQWRKGIIKGDLRCFSFNCKEKTIEGKKYYTLVVQNKQLNHWNCPFSLLMTGELVNGLVYYFFNKTNRDRTHAYLMKDIKDNDDDWYD